MFLSCQVITLYALRLPDCYIVSLPRKHLSLHQIQKIVRLCPSLEYTRKFQKWWTIPKITLFLPLKWWLIPKLYPKTYSKWWQHTKHRIQYQHQICPSHKDASLSVSHKQNNKTVHTTRTYNKVIHIPKHSKHNNFSWLSTLQYKVIHTITHSIQYYINHCSPSDTLQSLIHSLFISSSISILINWPLFS